LVSLGPLLALVVVWYSLEWLQHDGLDILSYPEYVGAVICMPAAAVIEVWSGTALQYSIVMDQWSGVPVPMVYWYLWWAGVVLLMVLLVVVMTEDLLLVEVLGLSVMAEVGLGLSQDFPMVLLGTGT
jgi:hypothetical protein